MFEPIVVPGLGKKPAVGLLSEEIAEWVHSQPLRALVRRFGGEEPAGGLDAELAYLDDFTTRRWNFRRYKERNQVDAEAVTGADEQLVFAAADALGLLRPRPPMYQHYDKVVVLGGLVRTVLWRTGYAAHLVRHGVTTDAIDAISASRELARNEIDPSRDEYKLLSLFGLPHRNFEWEVMEDCLRRAFGLPAFTVERQSGPDATGPVRYRVASAEADANRVRLVVAPAYKSDRRANTADGYRYWASEVSGLQPGQQILAVTTSIYVPYQHAVALQNLGVPFTCGIDTVGVDFNVIDDSPSPQVFRGVHYLLELRSAIRAYRDVVRLLREEAGSKCALHPIYPPS